MRIVDASIPVLPAMFRTAEAFDATFGTAAVAVFDFDGVLCDPIEDQVYHLKPLSGEAEAMKALAPRYGIDPDLYDARYLRHLLVQALLAERGVAPAPGPLLALAQALAAQSRPFFVLTARSGGMAIRRMLAYLDHHHLVPQEIFCVGRVAKGRQLALVRRTVSDRVPIVYFDDSIRHVKNSSGQRSLGIETVHVLWSRKDTEKARAFWERAIGL